MDYYALEALHLLEPNCQPAHDSKENQHGNHR